MGLSQALLDGVAQQQVRMYGSLMEQIAYILTDDAGAQIDVQLASARFYQYKLTTLTAEAILLGDHECRIQTSRVAWAISQGDKVVRANGSTWRVINVQGGPGSGWYRLQVRQIG